MGHFYAFVYVKLSEDWIERIFGRKKEGIKLYGVSMEDPFV